MTVDLLSHWARRIVEVYGASLRDLSDEEQVERVRPTLYLLGADERDLERIMVSVRGLLRAQARPADSHRRRGGDRMFK